MPSLDDSDQTQLVTPAPAEKPSNHAPTLPFSYSELVPPLARLMRDVSAEELMPRFRRVAAEKKHDGTVVTEADRAVETALAKALPSIVDCPVLGEEMPSTQQTAIWKHAEWLWCVDPLDGTANFAAGKRSFGISVALMHRRRSVFGMIYDPNQDELFYAVQGHGAFVVEKPAVDKLAAPRRLKPYAAVSLSEAHLEIGRFKRLGRLQSALRAHPPCRKFSQIGASVLQWCHLAAGRIDVFLHAGERPWDYAAGALILEEAGGRIATLTHDDYWRTDDAEAMWEQSVIAARHPALFDEWKRWVRIHY